MPSSCTTNLLYLRIALFSVLVGLLITFLPLDAKAEPTHWQTYMCCSQHAERGTYQQFNPGLGYQHGISDRWSGEGGIYLNSHKKGSVYFGLRWTWLDYGPLRGTILGTCVFGYKNPMCAPLPTFELDITNNLAVEVIHIPKVVDALRLKWRLK